MLNVFVPWKLSKNVEVFMIKKDYLSLILLQLSLAHNFFHSSMLSFWLPCDSRRHYFRNFDMKAFYYSIYLNNSWAHMLHGRYEFKSNPNLAIYTYFYKNKRQRNKIGISTWKSVPNKITLLVIRNEVEKNPFKN